MYIDECGTYYERREFLFFISYYIFVICLEIAGEIVEYLPFFLMTKLCDSFMLDIKNSISIYECYYFEIIKRKLL